MSELSIIKTTALSAHDLAVINERRVAEFDSTSIITPNDNSGEWFLVKSENELVSFGRVHTITLSFKDELFTILGIASIVSIKKRQGYGRLVMEAMSEEIVKRKMTAIGFCEPENSEFYRKCGCEILPKGSERFIFLNDDDEEVEGELGDMVYIEGSDLLISKMLKDKQQKVTSYRLQW